MKSIRTSLLALFALIAFGTVASAADATPAGHWQWTGRGPKGPATVNAEFVFKDAALSGTISNSGTDVSFTNGTCKDGVVAFTVVREVQGLKIDISYSGKLDGDTITGTVVANLPDGSTQSAEWKATRGH